MAIMLDRTTTAASERSSGRTDVASVGGPGVTIGGVVLEHLPRWATEDAGKGQRLPRLTKAGRWLLLGLLLIPVVFFVWLSRYDLKWAEFPDTSETPVLKYISGPELPATSTSSPTGSSGWSTRTRSGSRTSSPSG